MFCSHCTPTLGSGVARLRCFLRFNRASETHPAMRPPAPTPKAGIDNIKPHMLGDAEIDLPPVSIALDSNECAMGASQYAIEAAQAASPALDRYKVDASSVIASAIAARFCVDVNRIAVGPGSDELLARLARAYLSPDSELIRSANGYLKVPNYAYANDATPVSAPDSEFTASVDSIINCVSSKTKMVYLANPDNPSGTYLPNNEIVRLHAALPPDVLLVLDCAYAEYVTAVEETSLIELVENTNNVVFTRTFSKIFGLAGARVGWLYGPPELVTTITKIGLTFPLSSSSLAACTTALLDHNHYNRVFNTNAEMRTRLSNSLTDLGLKVYPSQTNFVLAEFTKSGSEQNNINAAGACAYLRRKGVAIRRFASPAYNNCIRITIGLESEQRIAIDLLKEYITGEHR